jgi:hypothetical protein
MSKSCPLARHPIERNKNLSQKEGTAMKYTFLIYEGPAEFAARTDPEKAQAYWAAWPLYVQALQEAGVFAGGAGLELPTNATTIKMRDGQRLVQDGPYADTKEQLGGYFIIDAPDLDTALDWAARCPVGPGGLLEVRPNCACNG